MYVCYVLLNLVVIMKYISEIRDLYVLRNLACVKFVL